MACFVRHILDVDLIYVAADLVKRVSRADGVARSRGQWFFLKRALQLGILQGLCVNFDFKSSATSRYEICRTLGQYLKLRCGQETISIMLPFVVSLTYDCRSGVL